jgi:hypothetical protein
MRGVTGDGLSLSLFLSVAALGNFRKGLCRRGRAFSVSAQKRGEFGTFASNSLTSAAI